MSIFSDRLRILRKEKNITQAELAKAINKSRATVAGYEIADRVPDIETLSCIADYFDEDVDWLLGRSDIRSSVVNYEESPFSREAYKLLVELELATGITNSRGEIIINMTKEQINDIFNNQETQLLFLDEALKKTLDLFSLPMEAKQDLGQAIMSLAIKHNSFTPPN